MNVILDGADLIAIPIVGIALVIAMEAIKAHFGTESLWTRTLVITLALVFGAAYYFVRQSQFWMPTVGILTVASTIYGMLVAKSPSVKSIR